ncbi:hypothetical protein E3P78_03775 [Wallemia ichthyophaga]|nr:hypothetical protein E3P78_03775 [Wallemia ichthyophaga]
MKLSQIRNLQLPKNPKATPFEIFSLPTTATPNQIKSRYYELVRIYHPDKASNEYTHTRTKEFQSIVKAYELLSDTKKKQRFINTGSGWSSDSFGDTAQSRWQSDMEYVRNNYAHRRSSQFNNSHNSHYSKRSGGWDGDFYWSTYHHPANGKHQPVYGSNGAFIAGLIFFSTIVTLVEYHTFLPTSMIKSSLNRSNNSAAMEEWQFKANIDANRSLSNAHESRQRHGLARTLAARKHASRDQEDSETSENLKLPLPTQ